MPLYEYQCPSCNKTHEVMQKFSDPLLDKCPDCGGPVSKLVSLGSFALKGAGWYTTDYKKSSKPAESGAEAKSDTKPAESKAAESKPAEARPAADTKPAAATKIDSKPKKSD